MGIGRTGAVLAVLALGVLLHTPLVGTLPFEGEEGRRVLMAREMLATGDWVVPRVLGTPHLTKPPLYPWMAAAAGAALGGVGEVAARLPALSCTWLTALLLLLVGARSASTRAGLLAACAWLVSPAAGEKAIRAETEAPLVLFTAAATLLLLEALSREDRRGRALLGLCSGVALGLALLAKGPAALVFVAALLCAVAVGRRSTEPLRAAPTWIALLVGLVPVSVWAALVCSRVGTAEALDVWRAELSAGSGGLSHVLADRARALIGVPLALLPAVVLLPFARRGRPERTLAVAAGIALVLFLLSPRLRPRYLSPVGPWVALAGALVVERWLVEARSRAVMLRSVIALAALALVQGGRVAIAAVRDSGGARATAARIDEFVPEGQTLHIVRPQSNLVAYLRAEVRAAARRQVVPPGGYLILPADALDDGPMRNLAILARVPQEGRAGLVLLQRRR